LSVILPFFTSFQKNTPGGGLGSLLANFKVSPRIVKGILASVTGTWRREQPVKERQTTNRKNIWKFLVVGFNPLPFLEVLSCGLL